MSRAADRAVFQTTIPAKGMAEGKLYALSRLSQSSLVLLPDRFEARHEASERRCLADAIEASVMLERRIDPQTGVDGFLQPAGGAVGVAAKGGYACAKVCAVVI